MKIEFKPRNQTKVYMFENRGEAIVFWLCIAGLLILTFFTVFRYYSVNKLKVTYGTLQTSSTPILSRIEKLENQSIKLTSQTDSLRMELQDNKKTIVEIRTEIDSIKINLDFISKKFSQRRLKPSVPDSTKQQQKGPILKTFKIKTVAKKTK